MEGVLTGRKGTFDCPISLGLYGPSDSSVRQELAAKLLADRLKLSALKVFEREELKRQKAEKKARKQAEKKRPGLGLDFNVGTGGMPVESYDSLLSQSASFNPRDIGQVTGTFGQGEQDLANMTMADAPEALATELLPYQRQGLAWMLDKESPKLPEPGSEDTVQLWKRNGRLFTNIATRFSMSGPPPLASGGILADDMGLGKTLQVISLILSNSKPKTVGSSGTTLIVAPVGVMSNWRDQLENHTKKELAPRVLIYHGRGKKEAGKLAEYDVVISSYGALVSESKANGRTPARGLFSLIWRRVVLDEGHTIRNPLSKGALAAYTLRAESRWSLTGTPIINSLKDLHSQIRFLKLSGGLEYMGVFTSVLIRPLSYDNPDTKLLLQALMSTICLRRRKDMGFINLRLPELSSHVLRVKFSAYEQEKYDMFQFVSPQRHPFLF